MSLIRRLERLVEREETERYRGMTDAELLDALRAALGVGPPPGTGEGARGETPAAVRAAGFFPDLSDAQLLEALQSARKAAAEAADAGAATPETAPRRARAGRSGPIAPPGVPGVGDGGDRAVNTAVGTPRDVPPPAAEPDPDDEPAPEPTSTDEPRRGVYLTRREYQARQEAKALAAVSEGSDERNRQLAEQLRRDAHSPAPPGWGLRITVSPGTPGREDLQRALEQ